jgi:hypothetical protein
MGGVLERWSLDDVLVDGKGFVRSLRVHGKVEGEAGYDDCYGITDCMKLCIEGMCHRCTTCDPSCPTKNVPEASRHLTFPSASTATSTFKFDFSET